MLWRFDRSRLLLGVACLTLSAWLAMTLLGLHPDGAILGFSGTMWMLWGTTERDDRKRRERRGRYEDDPPGESSPPEEQ